MEPEKVTHERAAKRVAKPDEADDDLPPPPSYDDNPAIIDAHRMFLVTFLSAALFIGAVVSFIL